MHICTRWFVCRRIQCSLFSSLSLHSSLSHCVGVLVLCNILVSHQWKNNNRHSLNVLAFCKQHADTHTHTHINVKRLFVVRAIISILHASLKTAFGIASLLWTLARFTAHLTEFSTVICACSASLCDIIYEMWVFLSWVQLFAWGFFFLSTFVGFLFQQNRYPFTLCRLCHSHTFGVCMREFSLFVCRVFFSLLCRRFCLCVGYFIWFQHKAQWFFFSLISVPFGCLFFFCLCHQIFGGSLSKNEHNRFELGIVVSLKWLFFLLVFFLLSLVHPQPSSHEPKHVLNAKQWTRLQCSQSVRNERTLASSVANRVYSSAPHFRSIMQSAFQKQHT